MEEQRFSEEIMIYIFGDSYGQSEAPKGEYMPSWVWPELLNKTESDVIQPGIFLRFYIII